MIILLLVYYVINSYTIYNFSPYLFILLESILPVDNDLFENNTEEKKEKIIKRIIIQSFGYIILFFASLIMNEIIIFNFLGLNKNTFNTISSRGELDSSRMEELERYSSEDLEGIENGNENDNLIEANFNENKINEK